MPCLPSTITWTPMCPTKPSLNVAASGIPGGSYNTLIKITTTLFLQSFNLFECPRRQTNSSIEHLLCAGRGMMLGGRGTGQAQSHPLRIHPWVRPAIWAGPTFGPGHGALATVPWGSPGGGEGLGPWPLLPKWASLSPKPSLSELGFSTWGSEPRGSAHLPGEGEAACLARLLCEEGLEVRPWPSQQKGLHWAEITPFLPVGPPGPGCWSPEPQPCQFHPSSRGVGLGSFLASDGAWRGRYSTLGSKQGRWTSRLDPWWGRRGPPRVCLLAAPLPPETGSVWGSSPSSPSTPPSQSRGAVWLPRGEGRAPVLVMGLESSGRTGHTFPTPAASPTTFFSLALLFLF